MYLNCIQHYPTDDNLRQEQWNSPFRHAFSTRNHAYQALPPGQRSGATSQHPHHHGLTVDAGHQAMETNYGLYLVSREVFITSILKVICGHKKHIWVGTKLCRLCQPLWSKRCEQSFCGSPNSDPNRCSNLLNTVVYHPCWPPQNLPKLWINWTGWSLGPHSPGVEFVGWQGAVFRDVGRFTWLTWLSRGKTDDEVWNQIISWCKLRMDHAVDQCHRPHHASLQTHFAQETVEQRNLDIKQKALLSVT